MRLEVKMDRMKRYSQDKNCQMNRHEHFGVTFERKVWKQTHVTDKQGETNNQAECIGRQERDKWTDRHM